ncbi:CoA-binding protein [Mycobacterium sp. 1274756.6]|uniref:CoA-binding protein n=1 Tax=Mycobacterium sp. 1274756.6 TaxID=1834076 RepID=UPI0007FC33B7|nr:CoA-binding protein [Mycobacterium sp. 1274756.6]OBJ71252.1 CoA-binding protein [Mycobacterium sp. 1274756.6]
MAHDDAALRRILEQTRTVAVVGISANPARPSNEVYRYLAAASPYRFFLVNPTFSELDGVPVYPSLAELPVTPDLVDVFRRRDQLPTVLAEVLALTPRPATLWLQSGLRDEQVARDGAAAGLQVVMDRCLKVEYARLG